MGEVIGKRRTSIPQSAPKPFPPKPPLTVLTENEPTLENRCFLQAFEWNVPADQGHWKRLLKALPGLKATGIDNIWIPPACKGSAGKEANGYDVYDLYDVGEFEQKGAKATKWGIKEDLVEMCEEAQKVGVGIYFDAVWLFL